MSNALTSVDYGMAAWIHMMRACVGVCWEVSVNGGINGIADAPSPRPCRSQGEAERHITAEVHAARSRCQPPRYTRLLLTTCHSLM